jgi:hypothetical protein
MDYLAQPKQWKINGLDSIGIGQGPVAGFCEESNETLGYIKGGEFLD